MTRSSIYRRINCYDVKKEREELSPQTPLQSHVNNLNANTNNSSFVCVLLFCRIFVRRRQIFGQGNSFKVILMLEKVSLSRFMGALVLPREMIFECLLTNRSRIFFVVTNKKLSRRQKLILRRFVQFFLPFLPARIENLSIIESIPV